MTWQIGFYQPQSVHPYSLLKTSILSASCLSLCSGKQLLNRTAMQALPLIILAMFLNTGAQLLLKAGMERIGYFSFSLNNVWPIATQVVTNPFILAGLFSYIFSVGIWLLVLSRVEVGVAYPMTSLAYILTAVAGYYIFHEHLTPTRILGIAIILLGVYLVART